jgi:uncharacterized membrane protein
MSLDSILEASLAVRIHVATVVPAFFIGTSQKFLSTKGAPLHRAMGFIYLSLMTVTSIAAIFIDEMDFR